VFPRAYGKTESYGVGLMDLGTGTFVVASAISSRYARGEKNNTNPLSTFLASGCRWQRGMFLTSSMVRNGAVLLLGVGRMAVIKAIGYQEHESEYGTHWNFFVTLFCVWVIADVVHGLVPRQGWIAPTLYLSVLMGYQIVLVQSTLTDYVLTAPRLSFFSKNREGFCSLPGYATMYLLSEWFSSEVFFAVPAASSAREAASADATSHPVLSPVGTKDCVSGDQKVVPACTGVGNALQLRWRRLCLDPGRTQLLLVLLAAAACTTAWGIGSMAQPTSRRLANLPYVCLVLAISLFNMASLMVVDILGNPAAQVAVIEAFSNYQLQIFIVANVLTGSVNMCVPTIYVPDYYGLAIISIYITFLILIAWIVKYHRSTE
jgi:glucosaminylphosphatidylinositol acyltransferase